MRNGVLFLSTLCMFNCKPKNTENGMEREQKILIELCKKFAKSADAYEERAYGNGEYRMKGFYPNFNALFEKHAHGKENRLLSDYDFRSPPRYSEITNAIAQTVTRLEENRYQVTFEGNPKLKSIRFTVDKIAGVYKLLFYETYIGIANDGDNEEEDEGEELWRKHKL